MARSFASLAVGAGILMSRIAGLVRDRIFAYYLGNSVAAGVFSAALRIPNLLQNLFGEGVLSASFIPVYARLRAEGRHEEAVQVAAKVLSLLTSVVTLLSAIGVIFAPYLVDIVAGGFSGETRELTVQVVRVMFPGVGLLVISAWCLGILNSHGKFLLSYISPVLWNIAIIVTLLCYGGIRKDTVAGQSELVVLLAWGTVVGALLQVGVQVPLAFKLTKGIRPSLSLQHEPTRQVLQSFTPVLITRGVVQLSAFIDQALASYLGAPIVAAMRYAQTLYLLPVSLFGMSISAAELPQMSAVMGSAEEINAQLNKKVVAGMRRVSYFVIPSAVVFLLLGDVLIATIYKTGKFSAEDVIIVWFILAGSAIGLLASTQGRICSTSFYAMRANRKPLQFALIRVTITGVLGYLFALPLRHYFGYSEMYGAASLTATAGFAGWVEFMMLRRALAKLIGPLQVGAVYLAKLWGLALVSALLGRGLTLVLPSLGPVISGGIILGIFGVCYLGLTMILGIGEGPILLKAVRRRLKI